MAAPLVAHPWDAYGQPTPRDVDLPPDPDWKCQHGMKEFEQPVHTTIEGERAALAEELRNYEWDRDTAERELAEAEQAIDETRDLIRALGPPVPNTERRSSELWSP